MMRRTRVVVQVQAGHPDRWASRHKARRRVTLGTAVGVTAVLLFGAPLVAQGSASQTTFKFSGSLQGSFSQANNECNQVGAAGGMFEFESKLKGSANDSWTVSVNNLGSSKKGGTFTKFGGITGNGVSVVVDGSNGKTATYWASKSGTLTISPTGGSLSVNLVPDRSFVGEPGKGNVHISGSWGCTAESQ